VYGPTPSLAFQFQSLASSLHRTRVLELFASTARRPLATTGVLGPRVRPPPDLDFNFASFTLDSTTLVRFPLIPSATLGLLSAERYGEIQGRGERIQIPH